MNPTFTFLILLFILTSCNEEQDTITPKVLDLTESVYASVVVQPQRYYEGDEPTGNLDSKNSENVFQIFSNLSMEQNLSLLAVTHDQEFAEKTDRIINIRDGNII